MTALLHLPVPDATVVDVASCAGSAWLRAAGSHRGAVPFMLQIDAGDLTALPAGDDIDRLVRAGIGAVHFVRPLGADAEGGATARFLAFLRDARGRGLRVRWSGDASFSSALDVRLIAHLEVPRALADARVSLAAWSAVPFMRFYYRRGPGFLYLNDLRPDFPACVLRIDEPDYIALFDRLALPCRVDALDAGEAHVLADLTAERLVARVGAYVVALPYRLRRLPIAVSAEE